MNVRRLFPPTPLLQYEPFEKELYDEHPEVGFAHYIGRYTTMHMEDTYMVMLEPLVLMLKVTAMSDDEVRDLRKQCGTRTAMVAEMCL